MPRATDVSEGTFVKNKEVFRAQIHFNIFDSSSLFFIAYGTPCNHFARKIIILLDSVNLKSFVI